MTEGTLKESFWRMSFRAYIPAMCREVMTSLWIMRGPQGLKGQNKFRKVII